MQINGHCHCGNIRFTLATGKTEAEINPRACQCGFCRAHGAQAWSDPAGSAEIEVHDESRLHRYTFALNTAEFLICAVCGCYVGAMLTDGDRAWSTLNLRLTELDDRPATPADYDAETEAERIARRKRAWTPTRLTCHAV